MTLAEALAKRPELAGEAFNFSCEQQLSVLDLVRRILGLMSCSLHPDVQNSATNEIRHQYLNAGKARKVLGWQPIYTLDNGLSKTIKWYREFLAVSA
jgi:CDP-glucose 4,6-dehydratase